MKRALKIVLLALVLAQAGCGGGNGDRVLVAKYMYDPDMGPPQRHDVVVFRYPDQPLKGGVPTNYIKRLLGLAGETIAIFFGQLFFSTALAYPEDQEKTSPLDLWRPDYMHTNDDKAAKVFKDGNFDIIRKPPKVMLGMRRIVFDNDHQAKDLVGILPPRWNPAQGSDWAATDAKGFTFAGAGEKADWLRYQHILRPNDWPNEGKLGDQDYDEKIKGIKNREHEPMLITDFLSYNSRDLGFHLEAPNWVGNLMLELELKVDKGEGQFWMELTKGVDRFQARWDLGTGKCKLVRLKDGAKEEELAENDTVVQGPGTYQIRFANFDERLTVWVNRNLPFGDGVNYTRPWKYDKDQQKWRDTGPTENDRQPASIAAIKAGVQVNHLKLWRDSYYTIPSRSVGPSDNDWSDPAKWAPLRQLPFHTMYVQPGHYLCLGDNSPQSSDSRMWGLVPERLLLGRALVVYFPFNRIEVIH